MRRMGMSPLPFVIAFILGGNLNPLPGKPLPLLARTRFFCSRVRLPLSLSRWRYLSLFII